MFELHTKKCIPCEEGTEPLTPEQIREHLKNVNAWNVKPREAATSQGTTHIEKTLTFVDFRHALGFVNEVGDLAEHEGHHPDLNIHSWNKVTITLSTHSIKGLSENDFIMATKIDQILKDDVK
ncbi:MAG: 4a-hydroxytetrahydrobiopterin dehydratase [bacterium]|nr:4a-hydroxytetrahydrobiopterin dehydratase [bacterium]